MANMGKVTKSWAYATRASGLKLAIVAALALSLGACGVIAENNQQDGSNAATAPATKSSSPTTTPSPNPTPGKGPACPELRCTSITVTGDMLVHTQLWQQARADAVAAG